jgi:hypothetical protein
VYYTRADAEEQRITQNLIEVFGVEQVKGGDWADPYTHPNYNALIGHNYNGQHPPKKSLPREIRLKVLKTIKESVLPIPLTSCLPQGYKGVEVRLWLESLGFTLSRDRWDKNNWWIVSPINQ